MEISGGCQSEKSISGMGLGVRIEIGPMPGSTKSGSGLSPSIGHGVVFE